MKYEPIPEISTDEVEAAIVRNQPEELLIVVLSVALFGDDLEWAQNICLRLAGHPHFNVRGNAILGLGHLARLHRRLDRVAVLPIIRAGLADPHEYVRGHANDAADDIKRFLGWSVRRSRQSKKTVS